MCVIVVLKPGVNIPFPMLQNAVWNNPHGYGLITQDGEELQVTKKLNPNGTEPEEVEKLLKDNDKYLRTIHLRWMTEGNINLDNCHPFRVYNKKGKEVYFMHNGTLYDYKPGQLVDGTEDTRSDSRIFADEVLTPFLDMTGGVYGSSIACQTLSKFWGPALHNRGIILSNKDKPVLLHIKEWKTVKNTDKEGNPIEFLASNDTYFDKLERGFEYQRREEVKKKEADERLTFRQDNGPHGDKEWPLTHLKDISFKPNDDISPELIRLMDDYDLWTDEGLSALENLTELEIHEAIKNHPIAMGNLLVYLTSQFARVVEDREEAYEKHIKATKVIADLKSGKAIVSDDEVLDVAS